MFDQRQEDCQLQDTSVILICVIYTQMSATFLHIQWLTWFLSLIISSLFGWKCENQQLLCLVGLKPCQLLARHIVPTVCLCCWVPAHPQSGFKSQWQSCVCMGGFPACFAFSTHTQKCQTSTVGQGLSERLGWLVLLSRNVRYFSFTFVACKKDTILYQKC